MVKTVLGVIAALAATAVLAVGGYQAGWWLQKDAVNRTAKINAGSYNRQAALVDEVLNGIRDALGDGIPAQQRTAIVAQVCNAAAKLTDTSQLPAGAVLFIGKEC
jgi:hypothetical protein